MIISYDYILLYFREEIDEQPNNIPMFYSQESSSGGPQRLKLQSYRSSPYGYSQPQQRSSPPTNGEYRI
jgi:hypothetical protein